jgi:hypothetical protein
MIVSRTNGWTIDTQARTIAWPGKAGESALPDVSLAALTYFGLGYLESQAAARTVNDTFRKAWLAAHAGAKAADVPKDAVPASDSAEYRAELAKAHEALFAKLVAGYEVGVREGTGDPLADEADKIARDWLQKLVTQFTISVDKQGKPLVDAAGERAARPWYTLPAKRKVARDEDPYHGPKYTTFGEALAAFKVSTSPAAGKLVGKTADGKAWPFKMRQGLSVADAIATEAARRVAERAEAKPAVTLADGEDVAF